jgi:hypothetical protein
LVFIIGYEWCIRMIGIPQARSRYITGQAVGTLPQTLFTVPAGQIWRLWAASVQLVFQPTAAIAALSALDAWVEIQGGDIVAATAAIMTAGPGGFTTGISCGVTMEQGGRSLAPGSVIRVVSTALPVNTIARITAGALWSLT